MEEDDVDLLLLLWLNQFTTLLPHAATRKSSVTFKMTQLPVLSTAIFRAAIRINNPEVGARVLCGKI
jgi:hypothetical protein